MSTVIHVRVSDELFADAKAVAANEGRVLSNLVAHALWQYITLLADTPARPTRPAPKRAARGKR